MLRLLRQGHWQSFMWDEPHSCTGYLHFHTLQKKPSTLMTRPPQQLARRYSSSHYYDHGRCIVHDVHNDIPPARVRSYPATVIPDNTATPA